MAANRSWSRREVLKLAGLAGVAAAVPGRALALGEAALGAKSLTMMSDGNLVLPIDFVFGEVPREEVEKLLTAHGDPTDALRPDCNVTLLRDGERVVLFDVGSGPNFMASAGRLAESMAEAGIDPSEVTDVVFTHAHPDHLWGLVDDFDELVFADANYHINRVEWEFWRADDTLSKMPEARKTFVVGAQSRLEILEDRINLFDHGAEVLPGIEAVDTSGHTEGHTSFAVWDGSQSVMILGDAITSAAVSFARPDWPSGSDHDAARGAQTRVRLLDRLAGEQTQIIGFHLPHPGLGRVERDGGAYRYIVG